MGTVTLLISDGHYECSTNRPYGYGAGKLEINCEIINFVDTLFVVIPAVYGPTYVLSGKYYYDFDGDYLSLRKDKELYGLRYELKIDK